uniref:[histone H3]-trimethyl-L-lysine(4) demethylase n=1 Tax=Albugo laibachii Nc14 TaxID=890382 RepID=F0W1J5_9STRA|nr:histone demethylase putative [Albugo laibachii Nc14]|eukprot:CCA14924.1 histone demethylase putative [Albugo laibachii Nc14]
MDWDPHQLPQEGFICPPCPVFYPTEKEFEDPLKYISSRQDIGRRSGICKIVPPSGWCPPFAINESAFRFRTRIQQLNCIEGHTRTEGNFMEALRIFLYREKTPMQKLPRIQGQLLNLNSFYKSVLARGGFERVCENKQWYEVIQDIKLQVSEDQSKQKATWMQIEELYRVHLLAFEEYEKKNGTCNLLARNIKQETHVFAKAPKLEEGLGTKSQSQSHTGNQSDVPTTPTKKTIFSGTPKRSQRKQHEETVYDIKSFEVELPPESDTPVKRILFSEIDHLANLREKGILTKDRKTVESPACTMEPDLKRIRQTQAEESSKDELIKQNLAVEHVPASLEPHGLRPDSTRNYRLMPPPLRLGQKFYHFFPHVPKNEQPNSMTRPVDEDTPVLPVDSTTNTPVSEQKGASLLAKIKRIVSNSKKPYAVVQYGEDGHRESIDLSLLQLIVANGWSPDSAELSFRSEICQSCLRCDRWDRMVLCDSCKSGYHLFCLDEPLKEAPKGDWYCESCLTDFVTSDGNVEVQNPKFGFEMGSEYSLAQFREKANAWKRDYFQLPNDPTAIDQLSDVILEKEYWRVLSMPSHEQQLGVEYGSDVDSGANGSGFPRADSFARCVRLVSKRWKQLEVLKREGSDDFAGRNSELDPLLYSHGIPAKPGDSVDKLVYKYMEDNWNLNNIPKSRDSVLQHLDENIKGVMVPWMYIGMCFSTFCWHVEDHNFYSISYLHCGAPKTWYGVPCDKAELFEQTMKKLTPELFTSQPDLHMQLVTMFSPVTLRQHGVPVYRATQRPGEFMVTFPSGYHAGFNHGFNCAEAVNFATIDWLPWGFKSIQKYRKFSKLPVFAHEALVCSLVDAAIKTQAFDYQGVLHYLLPAFREIYDEYVRFESDVKMVGIRTSDRMENFRTNAHLSSMPARASKMMVSRENSGPQRMNNSVQGGKMVASASNTSQSMRIVSWAGRSGKHEGLRCVICKQYCYLQAVACTKCRHGSTVGCFEHYKSMCTCEKDSYYVLLSRFPATHLTSLISALEDRLDSVRKWHTRAESILQVAAESAGPEGLQRSKRTISFEYLEDLRKEGKQWKGVSKDVLRQIDAALQSVTPWVKQLDATLKMQEQQAKMNAEFCIDSVLTQLEALDTSRKQLLVSPPQSVCKALSDKMAKVRLMKENMESVLDSVDQLRSNEPQHHENQLLERKSVKALARTNTRISELIEQLDDIAQQLGTIGFVANAETARLSDAKDYLSLLYDLNLLFIQLAHRHKVLGRRSAVIFGRREMNRLDLTDIEADMGAIFSPQMIMEESCHEIVQRIKKWRIKYGKAALRKVDCLISMLEKTTTMRSMIQSALHDLMRDSDELEALWNDLCGLTIIPDGTEEFGKQLLAWKNWESRVNIALFRSHSPSEPGGSRTRKKIKTTLEKRPRSQDLEIWYKSAAECFVPMSSHLRKLLVEEIQRCQDWEANLRALFLSPAKETKQVSTLLSKAITKLERFHQRDIHPSMRVHCVCRQVVCEKAKMVTCTICRSLFHRRCVNFPKFSTIVEDAEHPFMCSSCLQTSSSSKAQNRVASEKNRTTLYCICRDDREDSTMICCDFCDEWYHIQCIGINVGMVDRMEAYRCQRCLLCQNLYYLDKPAIEKDSLGSRPALTQIQALLGQLESSLVAVPQDARNLVAYMELVNSIDISVKSFADAFLSRFSAEKFSDIDIETEENNIMLLMQQLTDLEVDLEQAYASLIAVHWCLRACQLVLTCTRPPKYAHLVILLLDVKNIKHLASHEDYTRIQRAIQDHVEKATAWIQHARTLQINPSDFEQSVLQLDRERHELSRFLELPAAEVKFIRDSKHLLCEQ